MKPIAVLQRATELGKSGAPMLDVALCYATAGWPVFPCSLEKKPLVPTGFNARTHDVQRVREWWTLHPQALVGIIPGDQGLAALDVDTPLAAASADSEGYLDAGLVVHTGGTSQPFEYKGSLMQPAHIYIVANGIVPPLRHVVVRQHSGYVIAPGSRRGDRMYEVVSVPAEMPEVKHVAPQRETQHWTASQAPDFERAIAIVRQMPNNADTRETFVGVAHMIRGALGEAGRDVFLEWARRWEGPTDEAENERVWDTLPPSMLGWDSLWKYAEMHGVNVTREREQEARDEFDCLVSTPPAEMTAAEKLAQAVKRIIDAPDDFERARAFRYIRALGFSHHEIELLLRGVSQREAVDAAPLSLRELNDRPELLRLPPTVLPHLCWQGMKTLLSAREKAGKTTLAMAGIAALTRGDDFLGEPTEASTVLWLTEEPLPVLVARTQQFGVDPDRLFVVSMGASPITQLKRAVLQVRPRLAVVDTLWRFAMLQDENASGEWLPVVTALDEISALGISLLILAHSTKSSEHGEYRGSSVIGGYVDAILGMRGVKGDPTLRKISGKGRLSFGRPFAVRLHGETSFALEGDVEEEEELGRRIVGALQNAGGEANASTLYATLGGRKAALHAVLQRLVEDGTLTRRVDGRAHLYTLPSEFTT